MSMANPFIRSPFLDEFQPTLDLPTAQAPLAVAITAPATPAVAPVASTAVAGGKTSVGNYVKSLFTDPKKRTILIVVALLVALGIGLFFVHRSFQRRKRRVDEDEEAQEQLNAGQQERENTMGTAPAAGSQVVVHPPVGSGPSSSSGFQQPGWDQSVGTSAQQNDRRMQDAQFRIYQQQQQQMGAFPPGQPQPYPLSPGQLPNLNVNPNATGGGQSMGSPLPGSPEDGGYDPI